MAPAIFGSRVFFYAWKAAWLGRKNNGARGSLPARRPLFDHGLSPVWSKQLFGILDQALERGQELGPRRAVDRAVID